MDACLWGTAAVALRTGLVELMYGSCQGGAGRAPHGGTTSPHVTARRQEPRATTGGGAASDVSAAYGLPAGVACLPARLVP
jgi:hypothetical protein